MGISALEESFGFGGAVQQKEMQVPASGVSSKNDFDFLIGKWKIHNRKIKSRLSNSKEWIEFEATGEMFKILGGIGNTDNFLTTLEGRPFEGRTLRFFNPKTKLWSIYWADSNTGNLDSPVTGSFEGDIGKFYAKDTFDGKKIIVMFQWDRTNPDKPIWSQAFSPDNGKTWEWNWHMNFYRSDELDSNQIIKVIELRNYLLNQNSPDKFHNYFQDHFIESQNILNGYILGQFHIKGIDNRFFWLRGFYDMASRLNFLKAFYDKSNAWKKYGAEANEMMLDSSQVHLLRPLNRDGDWQMESHGVLRNDFMLEGKVVVIDYYFTKPGKLGELIDLFKVEYFSNEPMTKTKHTTLWITEKSKSEFRHPVIQDNNLLVSITSFQNREEHNAHLSIDSALSKASGLLSDKESVVLYPF
jgi:hypothetical protein